MSLSFWTLKYLKKQKSTHRICTDKNALIVICKDKHDKIKRVVMPHLLETQNFIVL